MEVGLYRVLAVAMACDRCRVMEPGTWVDLASWLLAHDEAAAQVEEVVELACLCQPQEGTESLELRLQALPAIGLPREAVTILVRTARAGLLAAQPRCGH